jgi:hypothetical protein
LGVAALIFDFILAVMAAERISYQACIMESNWKQMFSKKSLNIKSIEISVSSLPSALILLASPESHINTTP